MNANLKKTKYHNIVRRKKSDKNAIRSQRPKTGLGSIPIITLTDHQKHLLVHEALAPGISKLKAIKAFFQVHFPNEYINHDIYKDWDRCSITRSKLTGWMNNVNTLGCLNKPRKPFFLGKVQDLAERLLTAKSIIADIKNSSKRKLDLTFTLTASKLAAKMGISRSTANKYLNTDCYIKIDAQEVSAITIRKSLGILQPYTLYNVILRYITL